MRNLLWKFVALVGVTGVGIMVVLQAMEGLSIRPEMGTQQASASSTEKTFAENPSTPDAGHRPGLPPLQTTETVAFTDPVSPAPNPAPGQVTNAVAMNADPFPVGNPSAAQETPTTSDVPFPPFDENPAPATSAVIPVEFPLPPAQDRNSTAGGNEADLGLPPLPEFVPKPKNSEVPDLGAFSESDPKSQLRPSQPTPVAQAAPGGNAFNPFSAPGPTPASDGANSTEAPFDPYEPVIAPVAAAPAFPNQPERMLPTDTPLEPIPAVNPPLSFPPAKELPPKVSLPGNPSADNGPPIIAAPEFPEPVASPQPIPQQAEVPSSAKLDIFQRPDSQNVPTPVGLAIPPVPAGDPLDFNPPQENLTAQQLPTPAKSPGRASVEIPLAPPADEYSPVSKSPMDANPQRLPAGIPLAPIPSPPMVSQAPTAVVDAEPNLGQPFPDITMPIVQGPESALPTNGPSVAVPVAGVAEAPQAFVDPLDQLQFPNPAPPAANIPEHTRPDQHLIPIQEQAGSPRLLPEANASAPQTAAVPSVAGSSPQQVPSGDALEGVGVLGSLVPAGAQRPELRIEKTAPPKAALGQPMIYNIVVRNVGTSAAHEVVVEDQVPKGSRLTGTIPRGEMADSRLIWRLGVIAPGDEKKIAVRVIPTQEGQIGSVAKVSFVAEVAARTVVAAPALELEFTGPENAVVGDAVTYQFKISNTGSGEANKVYLRNLLPEGLNHPGGNDLEYEVGTLKVGESKEIKLTVNATKVGEFTNKAIITATGGMKAEAAAKVKIIGDRLVITRTGPKRRYIGRLAAFSNTIVNQTETSVAPVRVVEVVPAGMNFVKANAGGQFDPATRTVTWAIAELGPKKNQQLTLELMAHEEGPQASEVTAYDPNGTRAVVKSETTVEGYTALRLDVKEYAEPLDLGEQLGLRVVATNRGTRPSTNVVVKMTIPEEMEFVSAKGPVDFKRDGTVLTFHPVKSLGGQQDLEFDLVLKSTKAGDARLKLEIGSDQMSNPLAREEGIRILAPRP